MIQKAEWETKDFLIGIYVKTIVKYLLKKYYKL